MKLLLAFLLLAASAFAQHAVQITWQADPSGAPQTGFKTYRTATPGGCAQLAPASCLAIGTASAGDTVTIDRDPALTAGIMYCWVTTATNSAGESGPGPQSCVTIAAQLPPNAPISGSAKQIQ